MGEDQGRNWSAEWHGAPEGHGRLLLCSLSSTAAATSSVQSEDYLLASKAESVTPQEEELRKRGRG